MGVCSLLVLSNHTQIVGGGEVSLLALLKGLDRARWAPTVVVPGDGAVAAECRALGHPTQIIPLPTLRQPRPAVFRGLASLRRLIHDSNARLLHANGSRVGWYAGLTGRLTGRPVVWHVRVADRDGAFDRVLARLATAAIVNSKAVGRRFDWAPPGKVRCIYNGVDLARFSPRLPRPAFRSTLGVPRGAAVVGSVGRFVAFKGYTHLLDAIVLVRTALPGTHWLLVGDGELRGALERRSRELGIDSDVHFLGWRDDVPEILASCDLAVLPSLGEGFGRVLIEAMAMKKPVVATAAGGVPEIVIHGETGWLVPPGDPGALGDALIALLRDPERAARLGEAGRRRVESEFSLPRHVERVEALYRELLGAERGAV